MVFTMRESDVDRYVQHATAEMHRNNDMYIRCPCRRCKLGSMFTPCTVKEQTNLYDFYIYIYKIVCRDASK
jgi:hypothetical protein